MSKWEYKIVDSDDVPGGVFKKDRAGIEQYLNGLGRDGWELISMDFRELDAHLAFSGVAKRQSR